MIRCRIRPFFPSPSVVFLDQVKIFVFLYNKRYSDFNHTPVYIKYRRNEEHGELTTHRFCENIEAIDKIIMHFLFKKSNLDKNKYTLF